MTKINDAWEKIFQQLNIEKSIAENGYTYLSADSIKQVGNYEPRLMTKFDSAEMRPDILKDNQISIFSVTNGTYILFKDTDKKSYFTFPEMNETPLLHTSKIELKNLDTYPVGLLTTESQTIDFAYISGLLQLFTGDNDLNLTLRGRSRSGDLSFLLPEVNHTVNISGVQIELDSGFESKDAIYLVEAKIGKRDNFHIRQLYYPYLEWSKRSHKKIIPIFFTYSNGLFYLTELGFTETFGELNVKRSHCYILDESAKANIDFKKMLDLFPVEIELEPFPQADDLDKIIDLVKNIEQGINNKAKIAELFEIEERQGDYYANALIYLGFIQRDQKEFILTDIGEYFIQQRLRTERTKILLGQLLKRPVFREVIQLVIQRNSKITKNSIADIIKKYTPLNDSTALRRASSVHHWLKWLLKNSNL